MQALAGRKAAIGGSYGIGRVTAEVAVDAAREPGTDRGRRIRG